MEEARYELRRIRDELDYLLATGGDGGLRTADVPFFKRCRQVWRQTSTRWLDQRRRGDAVP
jgi:hypothetical protein